MIGKALALAAASLLCGAATGHGAAPTVPANLPSVAASLEPGEVVLARPFDLRINVVHREGTQILWPESLDLGSAVEEIERTVSAHSLGSGAVRSELRVTLQAFDTAVREIVPIEIRFDDGTGKQGRHTQALPLEVLGVIRGEQAELRPAAEPVEVPIRDWRLLAMVSSASLLGGALVFAWVRRSTRQRRGSERGVTRVMAQLSPHEEALARLDALESSGALDADALKDSFLEMSEIFRGYLGRRFGFSALDLTTSEIRSRLAEVEASEEWLEAVQSWLSRCDLVKYANSRADPDEARDALYGARILIDRTKAIEPRAREGARV